MIINEKEYKRMPARLQGMFNKLPNPGSEEVVRLFPETQKSKGGYVRKTGETQFLGAMGDGSTNKPDGLNDSGSAARFFQCCPFSENEKRLIYQAKPSRAERGQDNSHPTVKSLSLMTYLCKLILPPNGGVVMDPFMGSGTTGIACKNLGADFIGIEKEKEYFEIAVNRIG